MMNSKEILCSALGVLAFVSVAGPTSELCSHRYDKGTPVVVGEWHAGLSETRKYAEENGLPLMAVWSNGDSCSHCTKFEYDVNSEPFRKFMAQSGIVFMFAHSGDKSPDGPEGGDTHKWCSKNWATKSYPYVRFYWKKDGKVLVDKNVAGDTVDAAKGRYTGSKSAKKPGYPDFIDDGATDYDTYNPGGRYSAWYITNSVSGVFKDFVPPVVVTYAGGEFATTSYMVTNGAPKTLALALTRGSDIADKVATNWVACTLNDGASVTNAAPVLWSANETEKEYVCDLSAVGLDYSVTNTYVVQLLSAELEVKSTATITALPYPYKGGKFVTSSESHACLEADAGTDTVSVPLTRTLGEPCKQKVVISRAGKGSVTNEIEWAEGVLSASLSVKMEGGWYAEGQDVTITLLDEQGLPAGETKIACVKELENSPTNPYWLGERATLAWGDWTMDLDAATQKVASADGAAYTLVLIAGSKWCPDCVKTDRWLLNQQAFKDWAKAKNVICVDIDIPSIKWNASGAVEWSTATLLTYDACSTSEDYVKASAEGEAARIQSGAGYLSRHAIPQTGNDGVNARDVLARNIGLATNTVANGGFNVPGKARLGVPTLVVMNRGGRVIGRLAEFASVSPTSGASADAYVMRLNEMLEQEKDAAEEANDFWQTKPEELGVRGIAAGVSVSGTDRHDWYRVAENAVGAQTEYRLTGDDEATVELRVVQILHDAENELSCTNGSLKDGLVINIEKMPTNVYVCVSSLPSGQKATTGFFALTNAVSTLANYTLTSDAVLVPTETKQEFSVAAGDAMSVTVEIEKNKVYRFSGEGEIEDTRLAYNLDSDVYVANASGTVIVPLDEATFAYQIWNTGSIDFAETAGTVAEPAESYFTKTVEVRRLGGTAGIGKVCVSVDKTRSTALSGIYEFDLDGATNVWAEGNADVWSLPIRILANDYADGEQKVVLVLSVVNGTAVPAGASCEYTLTITDNDATAAGRVEIASANPAQAGNYVYARAGTSVQITLDRVGGSDGSVGCTLATKGGNLDKTHFAWGSRDTSAQTAVLSLAGVQAGKVVTVTLDPDAGTKAVTAAKSLSVMVVSEEAPSFATNEVAYTVYRSVDLGTESVAVETAAAGKVTVSKIAGSIPGGVRAVYDEISGALVFSGVPTAKAGTYASVYRVSVGSLKGLVVAATFRVIDPVMPTTESGTALNPACAKTRTFADLQVYSDEDWSRLVGLVTLTIPASGRLSAKYTSASGTVSLVAKNWTAISADGTLSADLAGTTKKTKDFTLAVTAFANGSVTCALHDPAHADTLEVMRAGDTWSLLDDGATAWKGYYTASLAQRNAEDDRILAKGDGIMTFKMTSTASVKKGKMAYAGVLPNGKAFSSSRTLWGYYDAASEKMVFACLPIFNVSSADDVSGLVFVKPDAATQHVDDRKSLGNVMKEYGLAYETKFVWTSKDGARASRSYEAEFDVYGTYYDGAEDFAGCCNDTFETDMLTFFALPELLDPVASWSTNDACVSVAPDKKGQNAITLIKAGSKNDQNLTLTFNRTTGLVSGNLNLTIDGLLRKAQYKGVVMPGWGSASCMECGYDPEHPEKSEESQKRPFVSGAAWYSQKDLYEVSGKTKSLTLKHGCPISIGLEAGK